MNKYDFVAIGDTVVDAFIRLKDAHIHTDVDTKQREIAVRFGDKVPYEFLKDVAGVGNSANASVSAARLGLKSAIVTTVGSDMRGDQCVKVFEDDNVSTEFVTQHPDLPTNYHFVLWFGAERTILVKHEEYPSSVPDVGSPKWIYLSSIGEHALHLHDEIVEYVKAHPGTKLAFQPGTFQMALGVEKLANVYQNTGLFFCNREEAGRILKTDDISDVGALIDGIRAFGPEMVVVTDGEEGAYAGDANRKIFIPAYPDIADPLDRTGAGDAFASTVCSGLAAGLPLDEALMWGPINSMSVVQGIGAQEGLLTRAKLEEYLANAPEDYKIKEL